MRGLGLAGLCALVACGDPADYLIVHVDARAAVHDARALVVSLGNAGTTRMDHLALGDRAFPVTFSISAPGRSGDLAIAIDAEDEAGLRVGHGTATTPIEADDASVLLDTTDFVVNTDYAGDQAPSTDFEAAGFQLAALPDGTWTVVFRDRCPSDACSMLARRFDRRGAPVATAAAAGDNAFAVSARLTTQASIPAIAAIPAATIAVWDYFDTGSSGHSGVACRSIDASGALGSDQVAVTPDLMEIADVVSATAIAGGNFVVTWKMTLEASSTTAIRMATVAPDCRLIGSVQSVALGGAGDLLRRGSVAADADHVVFAWIVDGDLHLRVASAAGVLSAPEVTLIAQTPTEQIEHARVAALPGGGFALAVRWSQKGTITGTSHLDLFRLGSAGALVGAPALVTDRTGNDIDSSSSFALASRADPATTPPDDTVMVAWHACGALGDGDQCGVFARLFHLDPAGERFVALGDAFALATTTGGDQKLPSLVALPDAFAAVWSDASAAPPDTSGLAVRARIVYPPR